MSTAADLWLAPIDSLRAGWAVLAACWLRATPLKCGSSMGPGDVRTGDRALS